MRRILLLWVLLMGISSASAETVFVTQTTRVFVTPGETVLGQVYAGAKLDAGSEQNGFRQVRLAGLIGYVEAGAVSTQRGQNEIHTVKVVSPYGTETVVLRSNPSNSYNTVSILQTGVPVQALGIFNGFILVHIADANGFLSKSEIE